MIGDSLDSDIRGGNTNDFTTILVKTGNYRGDGKDFKDIKPTHVAEDVEEAVKKVIRISNIV